MTRDEYILQHTPTIISTMIVPSITSPSSDLDSMVKAAMYVAGRIWDLLQETSP